MAIWPSDISLVLSLTQEQLVVVLSKICNSRILYIPHDCNQTAHILAKSALLFPDFMFGFKMDLYGYPIL